MSQKQTADYTVVAVWGVTPNRDLLLLHRVRKRIAGPDQVPLLRKLYEEWSPDQIGIESTAFHLSIVQAARRDGLPVVELKADKDKVSRALTAAARLEGGNVWWPKGAPWLDEWESELLLFPNSRHDDQVDCLSYGALQLAKRRRPVNSEAVGRALADLAQPSPWVM